MPKPTADWSEKNIARVTKLWLEHKSAAQIAKIMGPGFTSNSVIGKVHRLKLVRTEPPPKTITDTAKAKPKASTYKRQAPPPPAESPSTGVTVITTTADPLTKPAKQNTRSRHVPHPPNIFQKAPTAPKAKPQEDEDEEVYVAPLVQELYIPEDLRLTLLQLDTHTCKWPFGDPGEADFYFCGQHTMEGKPYCEFHCRRAYHTPGKVGRPRKV